MTPDQLETLHRKMEEPARESFSTAAFCALLFVLLAAAAIWFIMAV